MPSCTLFEISQVSINKNEHNAYRLFPICPGGSWCEHTTLSAAKVLIIYIRAGGIIAEKGGICDFNVKIGTNIMILGRKGIVSEQNDIGIVTLR